MLKLPFSDKKHEQFRWFYTSDDVLVVGGKSDEQNELVLNTYLRPEYTIMHTTEPGSPFMLILSKTPSKKDIEETAIFCGCFSKQWKLGKKEISIDIFKGDQIYKTKAMKLGTFGVKGDKKTIKIKPELALVIQKGKFRSVPKSTKEKKIASILPGKLSKEEASDLISKKIRAEYQLPVSKDELMAALPSDKLSIK